MQIRVAFNIDVRSNMLFAEQPFNDHSTAIFEQVYELRYCLSIATAHP